MSGTIWLITEDSTDQQVVEALLGARGIEVRVRILTPTGGRGGISRLAIQIENLIATAVAEKGPRDCIAVLIDADEQVQPNRTSYEQIRQTCRTNSHNVVLVIAHDEIEAWLLADTGLCEWLGVPPRNCDQEVRPSDRLKSLVKQKGTSYSGRGREQVLRHVTGDGDELSPSMRQALRHLAHAPCVTPD
jgi:hypothetical protein